MNPIILALDCGSLTQARDLLTKARDHVGMIKIGSELWVNEGPSSLELGREFNIPIFLDLNLNDIPSVVSKTVYAITLKATSMGVDIPFISVHAFGGKKMIKEAIAAVGPRSKIAVTTLLTSLNWDDLNEFGFRNRQEGAKTIDLAYLATKAKADTFVCSPVHIDLMRKHFDRPADGTSATLICPGIRPESDIKDDQKRTKPALFALKKNKADYIVIGRAITQSPLPDVAAKEFHDLAIKAGR